MSLAFRFILLSFVTFSAAIFCFSASSFAMGKNSNQTLETNANQANDVLPFVIDVEKAKKIGTSLNYEPISPLQRPANLSDEKIKLGEILFNDVRLSGDNSISCAHCHSLKLGGADGKQFSDGIRGQKGSINSPTVFNTHYNIAQFWDGRAETLIAQAAQPVVNPIEMGANWPDVIAKLSKDKDLVKQFNKIYNEAINISNVSDALAEYERSLITLDSPFDRYLKGDKEAISAQAKKGYKLFKSYGCISCHQGANVGGNMFHRLGGMQPYYQVEGKEPKYQDFGRYNVSGNQIDKFVFKVPSLRMVTQTSPYFHDGSIDSLHEAIKLMGKYQLLRTIPDQDIEDIIAFLESLAGEYKAESYE